MTKIKIYMVLTLILISVLFLMSVFEIKDQYDKELNDLNNKNKELKVENKKLKNDTKQMGTTIENLDAELQGKRALECDCDCDWLRSFYDEHAEELGAYE